MYKIGQFLKQSRKRANLTQEDMAIRCGTSQATISRYESDKRPPNFQVFVEYLIYCQSFDLFDRYVYDLENSND